ncbi:MAG: nucleotidyltransferase domain-containing protein [Candidatus Nanoarchaeia archaeon]|nr:nucleotidyltransferase domain-containing protein [Candidatus Nanoarchaeia archaeon]
MNNLIKTLKFFADNKQNSYSIKKVSENLKMSYKLVYKEILALQKEGLISIFSAGKAKMCSFNYKFNSKIVEAEEERKKELFKNKDMQLLYTRIMSIKQPLFIFLVFGSYANKTYNKSSDIDVCIITNDKIMKTKLNEILESTPIKVHLNDFTSEEFLSMLSTNKENVAHEILKNNIILYGIESFYVMVNNAQ